MRRTQSCITFARLLDSHSIQILGSGVRSQDKTWPDRSSIMPCRRSVITLSCGRNYVSVASIVADEFSQVPGSKMYSVLWLRILIIRSLLGQTNLTMFITKLNQPYTNVSEIRLRHARTITLYCDGNKVCFASPGNRPVNGSSSLISVSSLLSINHSLSSSGVVQEKSHSRCRG